MRQHDEAYNKNKMRLISFVAFLMGFAQAILLYVMSSYFKEADGLENIGPFYLVSYAVTLIIFFQLAQSDQEYRQIERLFIFLVFQNHQHRRYDALGSFASYHRCDDVLYHSG